MSQHRSEHEVALSEFSAQLAALAPTAQLDRDKLMFAAGRRTLERRTQRLQAWLILTGNGCLLLSAALAIAIRLLGSTTEEPVLIAPHRPAAHATEPEHFTSVTVTPTLDESAAKAAAIKVSPREDRLSNLRLLHQLVANADDFEISLEPAPPSSAQPNESPHRTRSRELLDRYLKNEPTQL